MTYLGKQKNIDEAKQAFTEAFDELSGRSANSRIQIPIPNEVIGKQVFISKNELNALSVANGVRLRISLNELTLTGPQQKVQAAKSIFENALQNVIQD